MQNTRLLLAGRSIFAAVSVFLTAIMLIAATTGPVENLGNSDGTTELGARKHGFRYKRSEKCFMRRINKARRRHGMNGLDWDRQLAYVGRRHARTMANSGGVWHDDIASKVTRWVALGQNTGSGGGCKRLTRAFLNSSAHRANYFGKWKHVGVGVARQNGRVYVQQVFEHWRNPGNIYHRP